MKHIIIAHNKEFDNVFQYCQNLKDFQIYLVDSGAKFAILYPKFANKIIGCYGDLDSLTKKDILTIKKMNIKIFNKSIKNKNLEFTDVEWAINLINFKNNIKLFADGNRYDHFLTQILLVWNYSITLFTNKNKIFLIDGKNIIYKNNYKYISFYNFLNESSLLTAEGLLYKINKTPINNNTLQFVSNEIKKEKCLVISSKKIIVIQSND